MNSLIYSFLLGFIFGFSCVQCILPLAVYGAIQGSFRKSSIFAILFNIPRFAVFLVLGIIALISTDLLKGIMVSDPRISIFLEILIGVVLLIFSAELFGIFDFDKTISRKIAGLLEHHFQEVQLTEEQNLGAFLRGLIFSLVCALESGSLILGIFGIAILTMNKFLAFLTILLFAIGNVLSTTILAGILGTSTNFLEKKTKINVRNFLRYVGSIIIMFIALNYLIYGISLLLRFLSPT